MGMGYWWGRFCGGDGGDGVGVWFWVVGWLLAVASRSYTSL